MEHNEYNVMATVEARHWFYGGMRSLVATLLDPLYGARTNLRILDAGCGTGGNAVFLQRYGTVVGVDIAQQAATLSCIPTRMARSTVQALPFANNTFDLVTSFDVLYHRQVPDEIAALREMHRVLDYGGRMVLRLPAYEFLRSKHDRAVHTRHRYTATEVYNLVTQAGFFVERISYVNTVLFPVALTQRMLERAIPALEQHESDLTMPHPIVNRILRVPLALESAWLSFGYSFPLGLSILCLAYSGKIEQVMVRW